MAKRLVVACGSGVATSTTIAEKIKQRFENDNISCNVEAVDYKSIMNELPSFFNLYPEDFCLLYQADLEVLEKRMMVS